MNLWHRGSCFSGFRKHRAGLPFCNLHTLLFWVLRPYSSESYRLHPTKGTYLLNFAHPYQFVVSVVLRFSAVVRMKACIMIMLYVVSDTPDKNMNDQSSWLKSLLDLSFVFTFAWKSGEACQKLATGSSSSCALLLVFSLFSLCGLFRPPCLSKTFCYVNWDIN